MTAPTNEPRIGDAFGETLVRCWEMGAQRGVVPEIVERDDGFINAHDAARYFGGPDVWSSPECWACEQASGRVLDVGCGAGRHALALSEAGYDVVGIDPSPGAVKVTRERGVNAVEASLPNFPSDLGTFDSILLLGNNVALLGSHEGEALGAIARVARPNARLMASGIDPYGTGDSVHRTYHERNRQLGRLPGHLRIRVRHRDIATDWFDYVLRSEEELVESTRGAPWDVVAFERDGGTYCVRMDLRDKPIAQSFG